MRERKRERVVVLKGKGIEGRRMKGTIDTNVSLYWRIERGEERVVVLKEKVIEGRRMKSESGCVEGEGDCRKENEGIH